MIANQVVGVRNVETAMFYDLQFFVDKDMPLILIRPEGNEWKYLVGCKDDVSLVGRVLEELRELPTYRCRNAGGGVKRTLSGRDWSTQQFALDSPVNKLFGRLKDNDKVSFTR